MATSQFKTSAPKAPRAARTKVAEAIEVQAPSRTEQIHAVYEREVAKLGGYRGVIAFAVSIVAAYFTGAAVTAVAEVLSYMALMSTGSTVLCGLIYVIGFMLALYAGWQVGSAVAHYIYEGHIDEHVAYVRRGVSSLCNSVASVFRSTGVDHA
jgi:hypothetical protein